MTQTQTTAPGEAEGPVVGHIETDTFCSACGYNLHSQKVLRDTRLGIPVARCPECGAWQAAGHATSAGQVWLKRAGVFLVVLWVAFVLLVVGIISLILIAIDARMPEIFSNIRQLSATSWGNVPTWPATAADWDAMISRCLGTVFMAMMVSTALGIFASVTFCYVRRFWPWLVMTIPLAASGIAFIFNGYAPGSPEWTSHFLRISLLTLAIQLIPCTVALILGRPITRLLLSILLPQKLRQYISALWTCDGRTPPWQKSES